MNCLTKQGQPNQENELCRHRPTLIGEPRSPQIMNEKATKASFNNHPTKKSISVPKMMTDIQAAAHPEAYTPDWIRPLDLVSENLARLIERYQFVLRSTRADHQYDFYIEKTGKTKANKMPFSISTQIGEIWIKDFDLFFLALTGVPIEANEIHLIKKRMVLALTSAPIEIKTLFGWITPNFSSPMPGNLTPLRFRLHAPDCDVVTIAYADNQVWARLLKQESLEAIEYQHEGDSLLIKRYLTLGHSHMTRGDLKTLRVGDLLRLDVSNFDSHGEGHINVSDRLFKVNWIERGHDDVFEIISETSTMKESEDFNDQSDTDYSNDQNDTGYSNDNDHEASENNDNAQPQYLAETSHQNNAVMLRSTNELPIKIDVNVGTFVMDERQVSKLRPCDLIRVDPSYRNRVSLQVNNAEIGIGEIISLNGEVAIQIVRMWGNS
jgi:flagellar motor switch/type III secretory pathway protein FliN